MKSGSCRSIWKSSSSAKVKRELKAEGSIRYPILRSCVATCCWNLWVWRLNSGRKRIVELTGFHTFWIKTCPVSNPASMSCWWHRGCLRENGKTCVLLILTRIRDFARDCHVPLCACHFDQTLEQNTFIMFYLLSSLQTITFSVSVRTRGSGHELGHGSFPLTIRKHLSTVRVAEH